MKELKRKTNRIAQSDLGYLYRYKIRLDETLESGVPNVDLVLVEYPIIKITPKGYWIVTDDWKDKSKWVPADALRRFACKEEKDALTSFRARMKSRLKILRNQIKVTEVALRIADHIKS